MDPWATLSWISAAILLIAGITLALWALFRDRSRGRKRCPRCWYDLSSLVKPGTLPTCPECGHAPKSGRQLNRTRRRWGWAAIAVLALLWGTSLAVWPTVSAHGWLALAPSSVLAHMGFHDASSPSRYSPIVERRLFHDDLWPGERRLIVRSALRWLREAPGDEQRIYACDLLSQIGARDPRITPALLDSAANDPASKVRERAIQSLLAYRADAHRAIPLLVTIAESDPSVDVRVEAIFAIGYYGRTTQTATAVVLRSLSDPEPAIRAAAAWATGLVTADPAHVVPQLISMLYDPSEQHAWEKIVFALGMLGPDSSAAVPRLVEMLANDETQFQDPLLRTLGLIGPAASPALPGLRAVHSAPETPSWNRYLAASAIAVLEGEYPDVFRAHAASLSSTHWRSPKRVDAARELRLLAEHRRPFPADAVSALVDALRGQPRRDVSALAAEALSLLPEAHLEPVISSLRHYASSTGNDAPLQRIRLFETQPGNNHRKIDSSQDQNP